MLPPIPNIPIISAIIEREHSGQTEVLIQTRWKPKKDPVYSGAFEIPAGWIETYENIYDALKREVLEETGLIVTKIKPDIQTKVHSPRDDGSFAFVPFCCQQMLKGGLPWIGFVFVCEVANGEVKAQDGETKDIQWINKNDLRTMVNTTPEKFFTLQLGALDYYLNYQSRPNTQQSSIIYRMQLQPLPFNQISAGIKRLEIRLFDEKRRNIQVGDSVEFYNAQDPANICKKRISAVTHAASMLDLFHEISLESAGWPQGTLPEKAVADMRKYYSEDEEKKWGAVALHLS